MKIFKSILVAGFVFLLTQVSASTSAAACDVSYGYKPTITFGAGALAGSGTCSTATSLSGVLIVVVAGAALLGLWLRTLYRRGAQRAGDRLNRTEQPRDVDRPTETQSREEVADPALTGYLDSVGLSGTRRT